MELIRKIRSINKHKMSPSPGKPLNDDSNRKAAMEEQGLATLIVMIAVLAIIIIFCCLAAPGVRALCKKCCRQLPCPVDDPDRDNASATGGDSATPTIILLPYGRMLVVDRSIFAQLQADHTGIDFMELSANLIRAQRIQDGSTPSILDSEATSKGISPTSLGFSPPAYEDIFGEKNSDLPPSYSELSLIYRTFNERNNENEPEGGLELQTRVNSSVINECDENEECESVPAESTRKTQSDQLEIEHNESNRSNSQELDENESDNECYVKESSI